MAHNYSAIVSLWHTATQRLYRYGTQLLSEWIAMKQSYSAIASLWHYYTNVEI